jgi:flavodoxin
MKALIIFDSFFGNTEQIGRAIGTALAADYEVTVMRVGGVNLEQLIGIDLLVVGSPTRGFRPTPAISTFIASIPARGLSGVAVTAFDTRIAVDEVDSLILPPLVKLFGYAAKPIATRLEHKGGRLAIPPEGFVVAGEQGPLKAGELERAAAWASQIMATHRVPA